MSTTRITFDQITVGEGVVGGRFTSAAGIGDVGFPELPPPIVAEDGLGRYLGAGCTLVAAGDLLPQSQVTRVSLFVSLDSGGKARVVLPYAPASGVYLAAEARRRTDGGVELEAFLTDSLSGASMMSVALASLNTSATVPGVWSVESGPRFLRAWWSIGARFERRTPDLVAWVPEVDHGTWGFCGASLRTRMIELVTPVEKGEDPGCTPKVISDDPFAYLDRSSAVLVRYRATPHVKSRRSQVAVGAYLPGSNGTVADVIGRRLDPGQTIMLVPTETAVTIEAWSLAEGRAGLRTPSLSATIEGDPDGTTTGGIGSGRPTLSASGEGYLDPGIILAKDSSILVEQQDIVSDTGGQEARQQVSSRQRRSWDITGRMRFDRVRKAERLVGASGGTRPVWFVPPLSLWPLPVTSGEVSHEGDSARKIDTQMTVTEA